MMSISAAASDAKELLDRAAKANVSAVQHVVEELIADGRAPNGFKQKLQCTCRKGLGRDALSLAAEARATALEDAIDDGYALLGAAAATGGAEAAIGGAEAETGGVAA